jgi:DNA-binding HxlR family transcriptional regulator
MTPVELAADALDGQWTTRIVWSLSFGGKCFLPLLHDLRIGSAAALVLELQTLETRGLVERRPQGGDGSGPLQYVLTARGESLKPVVRAMYEWGLLVASPASVQ